MVHGLQSMEKFCSAVRVKNLRQNDLGQNDFLLEVRCAMEKGENFALGGKNCHECANLSTVRCIIE